MARNITVDQKCLKESNKLIITEVKYSYRYVIKLKIIRPRQGERIHIYSKICLNSILFSNIHKCDNLTKPLGNANGNGVHKIGYHEEYILG